MSSEQFDFIYTSLGIDQGEDGEPFELCYLPTVCILESPSKDDRKIDRHEGKAIAESLRLAGIRHKLFDVKDDVSFVDALTEVSRFAACRERVAPGELKRVAVARLFLHFSCHGNERGISLTNGDFITWEILGSRLLTLAGDVGLHSPKWASPANQIIGMSSCRGFHAKNMATDPNACPFVWLVGCKANVTWTDAVTAFTTLYHQVITKSRTVPKAIAAVNEAALAPDLFEVVTAKDVGAPGYIDAPVVVLMRADLSGKLSWSYDTRRGLGSPPCIWLKDQVCDPLTREPILDHVTGAQLPYFDDPEEGIQFMQANRGQYCQVERCAAQEIKIRFAHKY